MIPQSVPVSLRTLRSQRIDGRQTRPRAEEEMPPTPDPSAVGSGHSHKSEDIDSDAVASNISEQKPTREMLNKMLGEVIKKLRSMIDQNIPLEPIEAKIQESKYEASAEFIADIKQLNPNGTMSDKKFSKLVSAAEAEVGDIDACIYCYEAQIQRPADWFVQPCPRRHEVVWVKVTSFPYWPAKVFSAVDGNVFFRFFGDQKTASVPTGSCLKFTAIHPSSSKKKNAKLESAMDEAAEYIRNQPEDSGIAYADAPVPFTTTMKSGDEVQSAVAPTIPEEDEEVPSEMTVKPQEQRKRRAIIRCMKSGQVAMEPPVPKKWKAGAALKENINNGNTIADGNTIKSRLEKLESLLAEFAELVNGIKQELI